MIASSHGAPCIVLFIIVCNVLIGSCSDCSNEPRVDCSNEPRVDCSNNCNGISCNRCNDSCCCDCSNGISCNRCNDSCCDCKDLSSGCSWLMKVDSCHALSMSLACLVLRCLVRWSFLVNLVSHSSQLKSLSSP